MNRWRSVNPVVFVTVLLMGALASCDAFPTRVTNGGSRGGPTNNENGHDETSQADLQGGRGGGEPGAPDSDAEQIANWRHWEGQSFSAFVPDDKWQIAESMSGVDISSPIGDAFASMAYATNSAAPATVSDVEALVFQGGGLANIQTLDQSQPYDFAGGTRQVTEFTATSTGGDVHGVLYVDTLNDLFTGAYGFDGYLAFAHTDVWNKDARTLQLILNHLSFMGRNGNMN